MTDLAPGPVWRWDPVNTVEVQLEYGSLQSLSDERVLAGANAALSLILTPSTGQSRTRPRTRSAPSSPQRKPKLRRWPALAEIAKADAEAQAKSIAETNATMRAEALSGDALQRWWRPLYALELTMECAGFWFALVRDLMFGEHRHAGVQRGEAHNRLNRGDDRLADLVQ